MNLQFVRESYSRIDRCRRSLIDNHGLWNKDTSGPRIAGIAAASDSRNPVRNGTTTGGGTHSFGTVFELPSSSIAPDDPQP